MPASRHRRRHETQDPPPALARAGISSIDDLTQALRDPALDFPARVMIAGVFWFEQLLRKAGDPWEFLRSGKDKMRAALLLCVAMDGAHGQNDDLAPAIAEILRPYCPGESFAEGWERAKRLPPGSVMTMASRIVNAPAARRKGAAGAGG